jgi:hypothetical protein
LAPEATPGVQTQEAAALSTSPQDSEHPEPPEAGLEDIWEGEPLALDDGEERAAFPPGEETVDRPLAELLPPGAGPAATWLGRWVLLTGSVALTLACVSLGMLVLSGRSGMAWRGPLVAVDAAILMLVVRWLLDRGGRPGDLCRRVFGLAGVAVSGLLLLGALLHSATSIIYARPARAVLTEFLVLSLLGLAGCIVFLQSARGVRWACRMASVAATVFLAVFGLQTGLREPLFTDPAVLPLDLVFGYWPGLAVLAVCGAGLAVAVEVRQRTPGRRHLKSGLVMAWGAILLTVVGLLASRLSSLHGTEEAARELCVLAFAWNAAAFALVLAPGIVSAWRRRGTPAGDLRRAAEFAFTLVGLGGLACLIFWAAVHYAGNTFPSLLVSWGVLAGLIIAWLSQTDEEWLSRWGILPAAGITVACLCALPWLLDLAGIVGGEVAAVWRLATGFLWCALVVALVFAAFGALVRRAHYRAEHRAGSLRSDLRLLTTCGWAFPAVGLAVALSLLAARPEILGGLRSALAGARAVAGDILALGLGQAVARGLLRRSGMLAGSFPPGLSAGLAAAALALVLIVHLCAAAFWRTALWLVAVIWALVLAGGAAFAVLYSSRLFIPLPEPELATAFGRFVQESFAVRLLLLAVLAGLLFRLSEGVVSCLHLARNLARSRKTVLELAATSRTRAASPHLAFLVGLGVLIAAAGMGTALLLNMSPDVEADLYETTRLAIRAAGTGAALGGRIGEMAALWGGYAVAFALIAYLLLAVHEEARRRRIRVYPVVGGAWLLLLTPVFLGWVDEVVATPSPPDPGKTAALAAAGVMVCVFLAATLALWVRWSRLYGMDPDLLDGEEPEPAFAQSLGSVGLLLVLAACATVVHGALRGNPAYQESFARAVGRLQLMGDRCAALLEVLRARLAESGRLTLAAALTASASGGLLLLHALARYRVPWARSVLYFVWLLVVLGCLGGIGFMAVMHPLGTWSGIMVLGSLAALAVAGRVIVALARPADWLEDATA